MSNYKDKVAYKGAVLPAEEFVVLPIWSWDFQHSAPWHSYTTLGESYLSFQSVTGQWKEQHTGELISLPLFCLHAFCPEPQLLGSFNVSVKFRYKHCLFNNRELHLYVSFLSAWSSDLGSKLIANIIHLLLDWPQQNKFWLVAIGWCT